MRRFKASLALVAGLLINATVYADNRPKSGFDFELSNGREFVRLSALPPGVSVINFWRSDCPPCLREMPLLAGLASEGKVRVIMVALQRPVETLAAPATVQTALKQPVIALNGPSEPRSLLARFGNPHGALPHTVLLDARRQSCAQRTGEIDDAWLQTALNRCATNGGQP